jgi:hypothetical protein
MAARISTPACEGVEPEAQLDDWLYAPNPARVADRLAVYTGGYPVRVQDALAETYPAVMRLVGCDGFEHLARRYAKSVALTSYNLSDAGAQMPAFLRSDPLGRELPMLPDLAELEWQVARAFHATERAPLDPTTLGWSLDDWASASLVFQPSVAVVSSPWPLLQLWAARDDEAPAPTAIAPVACPEHIVVRRVDLTVRCECVSAAEAQALRLLLADGRLDNAAEQLDAAGYDAAGVFESFGRWVSAGMIAAAERNLLIC